MLPERSGERTQRVFLRGKMKKKKMMKKERKQEKKQADRSTVQAGTKGISTFQLLKFSLSLAPPSSFFPFSLLVPLIRGESFSHWLIFFGGKVEEMAGKWRRTKHKTVFKIENVTISAKDETFPRIFDFRFLVSRFSVKSGNFHLESKGGGGGLEKRRRRREKRRREKRRREEESFNRPKGE